MIAEQFSVATNAVANAAFACGVGIRVSGGDEVKLGSERARSFVRGDSTGLLLEELESQFPRKVMNLNVNANASGDAALGSEAMATGIEIRNSCMVSHEKVHILQTDTGIRMTDVEEVEAGGLLIGVTRGGEDAGLVEEGVVIRRGTDISIGRSDEVSRINARRGSLLQDTARAQLTNIIHRLEKAQANGGFTEKEFDVLIDVCKDIAFIGLVGGYGVVKNLEMNRSSLIRVADCDFGSPDVDGARPTGSGFDARDCDELEVTGNTWRHVDGDALTLENCSQVNVLGNLIGVGPDSEAYSISGDAVQITGTSSLIEVSSNRIHNTSGAAIRATDEVERLIYRLNESINVINAADRTVNDLIDQLDEVFLEGVFGDGSTRITVPSVTGTPGQQIILDVYAYPPNTQTVETHLHLGEHRFTYDANGRHELNAVLDGSAPPGWLLTFTLTDPSLGTSSFSPPVTRATLADTDRDGMPDFWEDMFPDCLDPNNPDDAQEDCDQDGQSNLEEYVADTQGVWLAGD